MRTPKPSLFCTVTHELDREVKLYCQKRGGISEAAFVRQAIMEKLERERRSTL